LTAAEPHKDPVTGFCWKGQKSLAFYENEFESFFLSKTRDEYDAKATIWVS
jgi:hypothetical protein